MGIQKNVDALVANLLKEDSIMNNTSDVRVKTRQDEIDEMIKKGEMSIMTECAYGEAIGDGELAHKISDKTDNK